MADLEFIQFHPTMLFVDGDRGRRTLISEAVRGEGGRPRRRRRPPVTDGVHPLGDLAPRDVVANAVHAAIARTGHPCVYLDVTGVGAAHGGFEGPVPDGHRGVDGIGRRPVVGAYSGGAGRALSVRRCRHRYLGCHICARSARGR